MKIVWLTWKDMKHPQAGGAELVNEELALRLLADGHQVKFIVGGWPGCKRVEWVNGYEITRLGNRYTVYIKAMFHYKKHLGNWGDVVIDECNTLPFFAKFYTNKRTIFFIQQLAREVWFSQMPLPIALVGYLIETLYLRLFKGEDTVTFAESTKNDLVKIGFNADRIKILSECYKINPVDSLNKITKSSSPTILFFSALREMKRPDHVITAFELAKLKIKELKLVVAGDGFGRYANKVKKMMKDSKFSNDIIYMGAVWDEKQKCEIMKSAHYICCTSVREGWGIIVSEAGSQGTPAIVYNVHGLRDAVGNGESGILTESNTPSGLANTLCRVFSNPVDYSVVQRKAYEMACNVNIDKTYGIFKEMITKD